MRRDAQRRDEIVLASCHHYKRKMPKTGREDTPAIAHAHVLSARQSPGSASCCGGIYTHLYNVSFLPVVSSPNAASSLFIADIVAFLLGFVGRGRGSDSVSRDIAGALSLSSSMVESKCGGGRGDQDAETGARACCTTRPDSSVPVVAHTPSVARACSGRKI